MRLDRLVKTRRIIDLQSETLAGAIGELFQVSLPAGTPAADTDALLAEILERKTLLPGRIDPTTNVRFARAHTALVSSPLISIGRFKNKPGEDWKFSQCVLVLLLVPAEAKIYPELMSELVQFFGNAKYKASVDIAGTLAKFRKSLITYFRGVARNKGHIEQTKLSRLVAKTAMGVAKKSHCTHYFLFVDTFQSAPPVINDMKTPYKPVMVVSDPNLEIHDERGAKYETIVVRSFAAHRLSQLRAAIFIGLMRGLLKITDRIACLGGLAGSNRLDTMIVLNVQEEFPNLFDNAQSMLPPHIRPEVLEKTLALATDLAVEGREGNAVGSMFIIGDVDELQQFVEPLILNPFKGYAAEERNILDPFMSETIKELALIDGAFVISGNGLVDSAGSFVTAARSGMNLQLQSGLGTRHAAGCAISLVADCVVIVVSSSGQITLFRKGKSTEMLDRSHARAL